MLIENFLGKEEIEIDGRKFLISKIPGVQAKEIYGEIVRATQDVGDIGMTFLPTRLSNRMLEYAAVKSGDEWLMLDAEEVRNDINNFPSVETEIKLEAAMIRKNFGFLFNGSLQRLLEELRGHRRAGIS